MTAAYSTYPAAAGLTDLTVHAERGNVELIDRLAAEWRDLCVNSVNDQPFYRPEWIREYFHAFAPDARVLLITVRAGKRLVLVLPLAEEKTTFSKVPVRTLRSPVNQWAGRFDAIFAQDGEGVAAVSTIWKFLRELDGWDLLQFRDSLSGSVVGRLAAAARIDGFNTVEIEDKPSPIVPIPSDPELRKQLPVNSRLRRELKSVRRQLAEHGSSLKLRRIETFDQDALDRFFELESSGWKGEQGTSILSKGERPFFDHVAKSAASLGYFTLYMLELNHDLIASHYGFTHRDCYYSVVVSYNEKFKEYSPGHLIIDEIVNDCAARGVRTYQTTGQDQDWKMKWTAETQPVSHHFVFRGTMGNLAYNVGSKLKPAVGRLLTKKAKSA
jgi:CelD/BcsL family acetyltransferase involved in cellulose biosynthesis